MDRRGIAWSLVGIQISPSILASDFTRLADELGRVADADWAHVDVMDNHFVPNLTLGQPVVEALVKASPIPVDCHLMIENPDRWAPGYAEAGARSVTFHAEAVAAPVRLARQLRASGVRAGLGLKPATPIEPYLDLLPEFDMILVMTVEPGFGAQPSSMSAFRRRRTRDAIRRSGLDVWVQVDGGSEETIGRCRGRADVFVAGPPSTGRATPPSGCTGCASSPPPPTPTDRTGSGSDGLVEEPEEGQPVRIGFGDPVAPEEPIGGAGPEVPVAGVREAPGRQGEVLVPVVHAERPDVDDPDEVEGLRVEEHVGAAQVPVTDHEVGFDRAGARAHPVELVEEPGR